MIVLFKTDGVFFGLGVIISPDVRPCGEIFGNPSAGISIEKAMLKEQVVSGKYKKMKWITGQWEIIENDENRKPVKRIKDNNKNKAFN